VEQTLTQVGVSDDPPTVAGSSSAGGTDEGGHQ
jgi:hypothetical protein